MQLLVSQVRQFHVLGFLALTEPLCDETELAWLRESYDRIFQSRAGREVGDQFDLAGADEEGGEAALPQILDPAKYAPEILGGRYLTRANEIVRQLLGDDASVGVAHAIFKPAGTGAATPWHQDEAYWDPGQRYLTVSVWMPLQEATEENGCLWFLPGSNHWEVVAHQSIGGDARVHGLEMVDPPSMADAICCPLPPGGVTIHLNRTAHYAGPNRSPMSRRALIMMGGLPSMPRQEERRFPWNEVKQTAREARARESLAPNS